MEERRWGRESGVGSRAGGGTAGVAEGRARPWLFERPDEGLKPTISWLSSRVKIKGEG